ncbi:energy-coupling factor ABC transporter permease [Thermovenabulum gondwanense]|uniref:Cobalt transport protein CbiM n=1 Tax=Thermovenabulum gondwanense TaxID=520767 RepID=A0A161PVN3_9FIRM|nr:energy-coupling factor ABC transporter permease [Thermovenabulum gondwanense]KYO67015.1 Cobalt transport protein CbiM [Thermovenabulum gondwanense]
MKKVFPLLAIYLLAPGVAYAMHIAEGFLPLGWCLFYFVLVVPFIAAGMKKITSLYGQDKKNKMLIAVCGAYIFLLSALKLPSVTGSCSHPTGCGLSAILFGPLVTSVLSLIVLLFQALLLAHGGLSTLGANTFSMGIAGPFVAYVVYSILKRRNLKVAVFLAAALGDLFTYAVTSLQLALVFPSSSGILSSAVKFLSIFSVTQIPLAITEGLFTVVLFDYLAKNYPEIKKLGEFKI